MDFPGYRAVRSLEENAVEGVLRGNLCHVYAALSDARKAIEHDQSIAIARDIGDRCGESITSWNMADELEQLGDLERAIELGQVLVDFYSEIGHPNAEKHAAAVEGWRASAVGEPAVFVGERRREDASSEGRIVAILVAFNYRGTGARTPDF